VQPLRGTAASVYAGWMRRAARVFLLIAAGGGVLLVAGLLLLWIFLPAPAVPVPSRSELVLVDVAVLHPGLRTQHHQTVRIREGRIARIRPARPADVPSPGADDLRGAFVLPGLIDLHVHLFGQSPLERLLYLAHGVTSVRDLGSPGPSQIEARAATRRGKLAGPRVFTCGEMLDGDPPVWPFARVVRTAREGREAVRELAARGADCVKVYEHLEAGVLDSIRQEAARHDLPVVGHVPFGVPFAEANIDDVQHFTGVAELIDPDYATWAEKAEAWGRLGPDEMQYVVDVSLRESIAHTPTLVMLERQAQLSDYERARRDPVVRLLPRFWRAVVWNPRFELGYHTLDERARARLDELYRLRVARGLELVRRLHRAGVPVFVGTDPYNAFVVPGASVHEEMELLLRAGLTPEEVWAAATRLPGAWLSDSGLGTLAVGAPADLLALRRDPTRDLEHLSGLEAVIAGGRLYPAAFLEAELERQREHFQSRLFELVTLNAARLVMSVVAKGDDTPGDPAEP